MVSDEHGILKNRSGLSPACARYDYPVTYCALKAVSDGQLMG